MFFHHPVTGQWHKVHHAMNVGVVHDADGNVLRVINPDLEQELDWHFLGEGESLIRIPKGRYRLAHRQDIDPQAPTLGQIIADARAIIGKT